MTSAPSGHPLHRTHLRIAWSLAVLLGVGAFLGASSPAFAKSQRVTEYHYHQVWPTAVRLLRVDAGYNVLERDAEAGYILFEAKEEGKTFRGSLELIKLQDDKGKRRVRIVLRLEDRPTYIELGLLDRLERKLRDEYGSPPKTQPTQKTDGENTPSATAE